jgi:hypothetical protein
MNTYSPSSRNAVVYDPSAKNAHRSNLVSLIRRYGLSEYEVELLEMFTLPDYPSARRIGSAFGSSPTAVTGMRAIPSVQYPTGTNNADLGPTQVVAFKFGQTLRSAVISQGLSLTDGYLYEGSATLVPDTTGGKQFPLVGQLALVSSLSDAAPHGPVLYPCKLGNSDQYRGWLVSRGGKILVGGFPVGGGTQFTVTFYLLTGRLWEFATFQTTGASGYAEYTVAESGYYAFSVEYEAGPAPVVSLIVQVGGNGVNFGGGVALPQSMCWAQTALPQFELASEAIQALRVNSFSLMYENTSSPLYRQGQTVMRQLPAESNFFDYTDLSAVANLKDSGVIEAVQGGYLFHKPTSMDEFKLQAPFVETNNLVGSTNLIDYAFDVYPEMGSIMIGCTVIDPQGRSGLWYLSDVPEFQTVSQWFDTQKTIVPRDTLEHALLALSQIPQFHSNDFHVSDIWSSIKNMASDVWSGVKELASGAAPLIPYVAPFLMDKNTLKQTMKTTKEVAKTADHIRNAKYDKNKMKKIAESASKAASVTPKPPARTKKPSPPPSKGGKGKA